MKSVLLVGGSDSSGGAGLEADQKVAAAHKCFAMTATAALTAQNTQGVYSIHETPSEFVAKQIDACLQDSNIDAFKTGMLASRDTVAAVADCIRDHKLSTVVVDPVMISTSGARLLSESAIGTFISDLLPVTTILTPNIPEANLLIEEAGQKAIDIGDLDDLKALASAVLQLGPKYVLLKGGHCPLTAKHTTAYFEEDKEIVTNILVGDGDIKTLDFAYQNSKNTHGTGCSLASAIACNLALGCDVESAVAAACRYVEAGIRTSFKIGRGNGPINHFHSLHALPFVPDRFLDYVLARPDVQPAWHEYTHHDFVEKMGNGTLPVEAYKEYMIQDYLYLIHFTRAQALAGYKAKNIDDITAAATIITYIRQEMNLHLAECEELGIAKEGIEQHEETQACTAYSRYVLDIGQSEDWLALQMALLPCLLGYSVIAKRLHDLQTSSPPANPNRYLKWINNYMTEEYSQAVRTGLDLIEKQASKQSPTRIEELVKIFVQATKVCIRESSQRLNDADAAEAGNWILGNGQYLKIARLEFMGVYFRSAPEDDWYDTVVDLQPSLA